MTFYSVERHRASGVLILACGMEACYSKGNALSDETALFFAEVPFRIFPDHRVSVMLHKGYPERDVQNLASGAAQSSETSRGRELVVPQPGALARMLREVWWDEMIYIRLTREPDWIPVSSDVMRRCWAGNTGAHDPVGFLRHNDPGCHARFEIVLFDAPHFVCFVDVRQDKEVVVRGYEDGFLTLVRGWEYGG